MRHKNIALQDTPFGRGIIATAPIPRGSFLIEMTGPVLDLKEIPSTADRSILDYYIQCSPTKFLGPSGDFDDIFNHSCNPNAGLFFENGKIIIRTIQNIAAGEEIFYDYSTVITNDPFIMKCNCATKLCRGEVAAFKTLPKKIRNRYLKLGMVQAYVIDSCKPPLKEKKVRQQFFPVTQSVQTVNA